MNTILLFMLLVSTLMLIIIIYKMIWIQRQPVKEGQVKEISGYIAKGAMAFFRSEFRVLIPFILVVAILLVFGNKNFLRWQAASFLFGAASSAISGFIGMKTATSANSRTVTAAENNMHSALKVAFTGGSVMGLSVAGLAIFGFFILVFILSRLGEFDIPSLQSTILPVITGFSLGASSIALFARVGGGIFTKAADVGADLVGKIEAGIPEDDPRNPATIADNVGDNVGDVAGMGADLFETYVGAIIGSMILGAYAPAGDEMRMKLVFFPLLLIILGNICSIAGMGLVRLSGRGTPQGALNKGTFGAAAMTVVLVLPLSRFYFGALETHSGAGFMNLSLAIFLGLVAGIAIGLVTEFYTGTDRHPVVRIVKASQTGSATNIISGLSVGMQSTLFPIIIICATILGSYHLAGYYGIGISALGMLLNIGIQLAVDAYGPIADNAGGIAVMSELPKKVRERTDELDAVGNTTAAIGKGFAIGSAALTAIILFTSYKEASGLGVVPFDQPEVITGILLGSMVPYVFSSLAIQAVGKAAFAMINEVRRQFRTEPGILTGDVIPDYSKCIDISTKSALNQMIIPGLLAVITPVTVGFFGGREMLAGLLVGVTASGVMLATFMSNTGGALDNAKKMMEADINVKKNSDSYKASVVGDTVGDPLKDTAGPSLNILIKLMAVISLVIAPILKDFWG